MFHLFRQPAQKCLMLGGAAFGKEILAKMPV
jgi:hypothetical protein